MTADVLLFPGRVPQWTFADRLRRVRRDSGLNQAAFAERLAVSVATYSAWETGRNEPESIVSVAERLEALTGVPRQWFLGWLDHGPQPEGPAPVAVGEEGLEPPTFRV